jgi:hypothetical protein
MLQTRQSRDVLSSLVFMAIGLIFCIGSITYGDVRGGVPSAGLFPCLGGMTFILLSAINLGLTLKAGSAKAGLFFPQADSPRKLSLLLGALFAYGVALMFLGFFLTTLLFMIFLLKAIEPQKWGASLIASFSVSAAAYILFEVLLKVQLPVGILGNFRLWNLF